MSGCLPVAALDVWERRVLLRQTWPKIHLQRTEVADAAKDAQIGVALVAAGLLGARYQRAGD